MPSVSAEPKFKLWCSIKVVAFVKPKHCSSSYQWPTAVDSQEFHSFISRGSWRRQGIPVPPLWNLSLLQKCPVVWKLCGFPRKDKGICIQDLCAASYRMGGGFVFSSLPNTPKHTVTRSRKAMWPTLLAQSVFVWDLRVPPNKIPRALLEGHFSLGVEPLSSVLQPLWYWPISPCVVVFR